MIVSLKLSGVVSLGKCEQAPHWCVQCYVLSVCLYNLLHIVYNVCKCMESVHEDVMNFFPHSFCQSFPDGMANAASSD